MKSLIGKVVKSVGLSGVWGRIREYQIFRSHERTAVFWRDVIQHYNDNQLEKYALLPKMKLPDSKIIWQYWGQGLDEKDLPEVIKICFSSVDRYKDDYRVIRLTDESIRDYIDLPDFVWEKRRNPAFNRVFFSDLLRLALLQVYGGVWLDATILLTDKMPKSYGELDYFLFQRDPQAKYKKDWKSAYAYYWNWHPRFRVNVLNSIFFAKKSGVVVSALLDMMLHYWKTEERVINYFFFQVLYHEIIQGHLASYRCPVVDDTLPHLFQTKINGGLHRLTYEEILGKQPLHKLTYFSKDGMDKFKRIINAYL